jgi:peptide/nickel transport system substrate-binding protein
VAAVSLGEPPTIVTPGGRQAQGELLSAGLGNYDHRSQLYVEMAEAIPSLDNGLWKLFPDGRMEMTWTLKPGLRWHDGAPLTTADLLFAVQLAQDPEVPYFRHPGFTSVESVEAVSDRVIVVHWRRPYADADQMFTRGSGGTNFALPLPRHLLEDTYTENKARVGDSSYWNRDYIGAGPFKLKDWVIGSHYILVANDDYVLGRPKIDEIEVRFLNDAQTLIANVLSGTVEMSMSIGPVSTAQAVELEQVWQGGRITKRFSNWNVMWPQLTDPSQPAITRLPFRQALMHALDRQLLVETIIAGVAPVAHAQLPIESAHFDALDAFVVRYDYDPRKAIALLEDLGYTRGADGSFRDEAGEPLTVSVRIGSGPEAPSLALAIPDQWKRIGVSATTEARPAAAVGAEYTATFPGFQVQRYNLQLTRLTAFSTAQIPRPETRYVGTNVPRYGSPELDGLIDRLIVTVPVSERNQVIGGILNHMSGNLIGMGIFYSADTQFVSNRITNVVGSAQPADFEGSYRWDIAR